MTKGMRHNDARLRIISPVSIIDNLVYLYNQQVWVVRKQSIFY